MFQSCPAAQPLVQLKSKHLKEVNIDIQLWLETAKEIGREMDVSIVKWMN